MADDYIQLPADGAGKKQRTQSRTVGANTVHETYAINTDATTGNSARVLNAAPAATDYGLVVRRVDPARTQRTFHGLGFTPAASETLVTLTPVTAFASGSTGTSFAVTSGKTYRLQALFISHRLTSATAQFLRISVRVNTSGAVATTSPIVATAMIPSYLAAAGGGASAWLPLPEGLDIPASAGANVQIGVTHIATGTAAVCDVTLVGYEY